MTDQLDKLRAALAEEIEHSGGPSQVAGYALGVYHKGRQSWLRAEVAQVLHEHGFVRTSRKALDVTGEQALSRAVEGVSRVACSEQAAAVATDDDPITFEVERLDADEKDDHARAWGIYRLHHRPAERSSRRDPMGARVFVSPAGIYAARGLDTRGQETALDRQAYTIAKTIVAEAERLLTRLDNTSMSRLFDRLYDESQTAVPWLCAGAKLAARGPAADKLVDCVLALKAAGVPANVVPLFRGGLTEQGVTESLVREMEVQIEAAVDQLRKDSGGALKASTFVRRTETLQAQLDKVSEYRDLLHGWDASLSERIETLRDAYARAKGDVLSLELPDWADESPEPAAEPRPVKKTVKTKTRKRAVGDDPFAI